MQGKTVGSLLCLKTPPQLPCVLDQARGPSRPVLSTLSESSFPETQAEVFPIICCLLLLTGDATHSWTWGLLYAEPQPLPMRWNFMGSSWLSFDLMAHLTFTFRVGETWVQIRAQSETSWAGPILLPPSKWPQRVCNILQDLSIKCLGQQQGEGLWSPCPCSVPSFRATDWPLEDKDAGLDTLVWSSCNFPILLGIYSSFLDWAEMNIEK